MVPSTSFHLRMQLRQKSRRISALLLFPYYYFISLLSFYFCVITLFLHYHFISIISTLFLYYCFSLSPISITGSAFLYYMFYVIRLILYFRLNISNVLNQNRHTSVIPCDKFHAGRIVVFLHGNFDLNTGIGF